MTTELTVRAADFMPALSFQQAAERYNAIVEYTKQAMKQDRDYGIIPGSTKPTLYKPGAEKLCTLFGLTLAPPVLIERDEDWTGERHGGEQFFYYLIRQDLMRHGELVASQMASCNSWESKYRYRRAERKCPVCGKAAIIKGREEYGGGWVCFKKKDGCGTKFSDNDEAITSQECGRVKNPDAADQVNTILKMAEKRALIAATLVAVNASEFFTQDIEDIPTHSEETAPVAEAPAKKPANNGALKAEKIERVKSITELKDYRDWASKQPAHIAAKYMVMVRDRAAFLLLQKAQTATTEKIFSQIEDESRDEQWGFTTEQVRDIDTQIKTTRGTGSAPA